MTADADDAEQPSPFAPRLLLPGGGIVAVDRPLILGRDPRPPRIPVTPAPRLIALPSPKKELSSSHVEVRPAGEAVLVTDLRSTNGTRLTVPGGLPRGLVPGESVVAPVGSSIDLGDGAALALLPPLERRG